MNNKILFIIFVTSINAVFGFEKSVELQRLIALKKSLTTLIQSLEELVPLLTAQPKSSDNHPLEELITLLETYKTEYDNKGYSKTNNPSKSQREYSKQIYRQKEHLEVSLARLYEATQDTFFSTLPNTLSIPLTTGVWYE